MGISTIPTMAVVPPGLQTDINEIDAYAADGPRRDYIAAAKASVSGGGVLAVDASFNVKWSQRFLLMGAGRATAFNPGGFFQIDVPAAGTVITGVGGATNKTVVAAGIPLAAWDALYYILPLGSALAASVPANFRVVNYTADFVVPPEWVLVALRNDDGSGSVNPVYDTVFFATGDALTPWMPAALVNAWTNYGGGFPTAGYRKVNGIVYLKGLIAGGTSFSFTLAAGFRPLDARIFTGHAGGGHERIDIGAAGQVLHGTYYAAGANSYVSLDHINFPAEV